MLKDICKIKENSVISVIGSGGKTSFVNTLAKELSNKKTLVSATTKFGMLEVGYDFLFEGNLPRVMWEGISLAYKEKDNYMGKLIGFSAEEFENYKVAYDYIILESDGSRKKKIKAWADHEPVIPKNTDYTVGVINLKLLGQSINEENTHRYNSFCQKYQVVENSVFTFDIFQRIINEELFKKSVGEKLLFINQIDTLEEKGVCLEFLKRELLVDKIIFGSLRNNEYWEGR